MTVLPRRISIKEYAPPTHDNRAEFMAAPRIRNRAARGVVIGVLLGAGLWGGILVLVGLINFWLHQ